MKFRLAGSARALSGLASGPTKSARAYKRGVAPTGAAGREAASADTAHASMKVRLCDDIAWQRYAFPGGAVNPIAGQGRWDRMPASATHTFGAQWRPDWPGVAKIPTDRPVQFGPRRRDRGQTRRRPHGSGDGGDAQGRERC